MTEWVRVQDDSTGHQFTLSRKAVEGVDGLKILDGRPAVDAVGRPLPAKHRTDKGGKRSTKQPESPATSEEKS